LGPDDTTPLLNFITTSLSSGVVTATTSLQVAFIATHIDPTEGGRDSLAAPINEGTPIALEEDGVFTYVGILLVVALVGAFLGLSLVVFRMRQRRQKAWREEAVMTRSQLESSFDEGMIFDQGVDECRVAADEELPSQYGLAQMVIHSDHDDDDSDGLPEQGSYTFDLGDTMKWGVLGRHGGGSSRRNNRVAIPDEYSDSDVDSWAQTDATLGSLEVRIGDITAEI
jgi:hypothetical protein